MRSNLGNQFFSRPPAGKAGAGRQSTAKRGRGRPNGILRQYTVVPSLRGKRTCLPAGREIAKHAKNLKDEGLLLFVVPLLDNVK